MPFVAVLQLASAIAGEAVPSVFVGNSALAILTLLDSVSGAEMPADATSTQVLCSVTLAAGTYAAGALQASVPSGTQVYQNVNPVTSPGGVVTGVLFQAVVPGPTTTLAPATLTHMVSNVTGWTAVTNPAGPTQLGAYSVTLTAVRPDGVSVVLPVTAPSSPATGVYQATVPIAQSGEYQVTATATGGGGAFSVVAQGQINAVAPNAGTGVPAMDTWFFVSATASPYQAKPDIPFVAADLRVGPVAIVFWPLPSDGDELTIRDWYNLSSVGSPGPGMPGGPINYSAAAGVLVENASSPGTFAASGFIAAPGGFSGTWKYSLQQNAWGLKEY